MTYLKYLVRYSILLLFLTAFTSSLSCNNDNNPEVPDGGNDQQSDDGGNDGNNNDDDGPVPGNLTKVSPIVPPGIAEGYLYGYDITATSEFVAVSAPWHDEKGNRAGAVFVFRRDGSGIDATPSIIYPPNPTVEDSFGYSIAMSGTTLVIGAPDNDRLAVNAGAVFVYEHIGNNQWNLVKELEAPNPQEWQEFGYEVATDGQTIAVGCFSDKDNYEEDPSPFSDYIGIAQGSVFIYEQASNWGYSQKLVPLEDQGHRWDAYGSALAIEGNVLAVGAKGTVDFYVDPGSVYIYNKTGDSWTQQIRLEASDGRRDDLFGAQIALNNNDLAITAPGNFNILLPDDDRPQGAAYAFKRTGGEWTEDKKIVAAETQPEDAFGRGGIALHEDYLIIGAPLRTVVSRLNGAVYFFNREPGWSESHRIVAPDPIDEDFFGGALGASQDMIFVGAHRRTNATGRWAGGFYFVE